MWGLGSLNHQSISTLDRANSSTIKCMKYTLTSFLFFTLLLCIYTASAVGIINSVDTPQYFTAEALIQHRDIDMKPFEKDPHYFVKPDFFYQGAQVLNVRGYLFSMLMIPLHAGAFLLKSLLVTQDFPTEIIVPRFTYELALTMLYTFLSATGVLMIFATIHKVTKNLLLTCAVSLGVGLGTFIWKYSSFYTRHGFSVFALGLFTLGIAYLSQSNSRQKAGIISFGMGILHGLLFGIDQILFIAITVFCLMVAIAQLLKGSLHFHIHKRLYALSLTVAVLYVVLGNIYFYNSPLPSFVQKWDTLYAVLGSKTDMFVTSAPVIPVLKAALFNIGPLPHTAFIHFDKYPEIYTLLGVSHAETIDFYGMFVISPFLLFGFLIILFPKVWKKHLPIVSFSFVVFILGMAGSAKIFGFWGGNQYDIRYFYQYSILLGVPTALVIKHIWDLRTGDYFRFLSYIAISLFILLLVYSLGMGWLGVINMYKPALTGERRIWLTLHTIYAEFHTHTANEYLDATFMNRRNAWVAAMLSSLTHLFRQFIFELLPKQHARVSLQSGKSRKEK